MNSPATLTARDLLLVALVSTLTGAAGWLIAGSRSASEKGVPVVETTAGYPEAAKPITKDQPAAAGAAEFSRRAIFDRILGAETRQENRLSELYDALRDLPSAEFPLAIADLLRRPNNDAYDLAMLVAGYWAERDLESARRWMLNLSFKSGHYGEFEEAILDTWGRMDSGGMFDWLDANVAEIQPSRKGDVASAICTRGPLFNPERALAWLRLHHPERIDFLYLRWAMRDGKRAAESALTESDPTVRADAICTAAKWWALSSGSVTAPAEWAKSVPDPLVSSKALFGIGWTLWSKDPQATADYFASLPQTNDIRGALKRVATEWNDLPAALGWSLELDDEALADWVLPYLIARQGAREKIGEVIASLPEEKRGAAQERWNRSLAKPSAIPSPAP